MATDTLYRYDEPTSQWVQVTNVNRIEVKSGKLIWHSITGVSQSNIAVV